MKSPFVSPLRRKAVALILIFYLITQAVRVSLLAMTNSPDLTAQWIAAHYSDPGDCFDGDYEHYFAIQYVYSPRIIRYRADGCP